MKKNIYVLLAVATILPLASCEKGYNGGNGKEREAALVGNWALMSGEINPAIDWNGDGQSSTDLFAEWDLYDTDDIFAFGKDNEFVLYKGTHQCDDADTKFEDIYLLREDNTEIYLVENELTYRIIKLTSENLVLESEDWLQVVEGVLGGFILTLTMTRQCSTLYNDSQMTTPFPLIP